VCEWKSYMNFVATLSIYNFHLHHSYMNLCWSNVSHVPKLFVSLTILLAYPLKLVFMSFNPEKDEHRLEHRLPYGMEWMSSSSIIYMYKT
jgi:hypothetical protein